MDKCREEFKQWYEKTTGLSTLPYKEMFLLEDAENRYATWQARQSEIDALKAQVEDLIQDAERYRILRGIGSVCGKPAVVLVKGLYDFQLITGEGIDKYVDKEIAFAFPRPRLRPNVIWTPLYTTPQPAPDTVPRAEYDKLLDAMRWLVGSRTRVGWLGEVIDNLCDYDDEFVINQVKNLGKAQQEGLQAIAEAEGK